MANTVKKDGSFLEILFDGTSDWDVTKEYQLTQGENVTSGLHVRSMQFVPAKTDDKLTVRNARVASVNAPAILVEVGASQYSTQRHMFRGNAIFPCVVATETVAGVRLLIELADR